MCPPIVRRGVPTGRRRRARPAAARPGSWGSNACCTPETGTQVPATVDATYSANDGSQRRALRSARREQGLGETRLAQSSRRLADGHGSQGHRRSREAPGMNASASTVLAGAPAIARSIHRRSVPGQRKTALRGRNQGAAG